VTHELVPADLLGDLQGLIEGAHNLHRMVPFARVFPDEQKVVTLSRQLSWSQFLVLLPLDDPLARDFYAEMCRVERWSVRTLRAKVGGMLYQRTALPPRELLEARLLSAVHRARGLALSEDDAP